MGEIFAYIARSVAPAAAEIHGLIAAKEQYMLVGLLFFGRAGSLMIEKICYSGYGNLCKRFVVQLEGGGFGIAYPQLVISRLVEIGEIYTAVPCLLPACDLF